MSPESSSPQLVSCTWHQRLYIQPPATLHIQDQITAQRVTLETSCAAIGSASLMADRLYFAVCGNDQPGLIVYRYDLETLALCRLVISEGADLCWQPCHPPDSVVVKRNVDSLNSELSTTSEQSSAVLPAPNWGVHRSQRPFAHSTDCRLCSTCLSTYVTDGSRLWHIDSCASGARPIRLVQLGLDDDVRVWRTAAGADHLLLLTTDGAVLAVGNGSRGELGTGEVGTEQDAVRLEAFEGVNVVQIAAGHWHSLALTDTNDVYVWGWNKHGQLALPKHQHLILQCNTQLEPFPLSLPEQLVIKDVAAGATFTALLTADGRVLVAGLLGTEDCMKSLRPKTIAADLSDFYEIVNTDEDDCRPSALAAHAWTLCLSNDETLR